MEHMENVVYACKIYFGDKLQAKLCDLHSWFDFWFIVPVSYMSLA